MIRNDPSSRKFSSMTSDSSVRSDVSPENCGCEAVPGKRAQVKLSDEAEDGLTWSEVKGAFHHIVDEIQDGVKKLVGLEQPGRLSVGGVVLPRKKIKEDELRLFFVGDTGTGEEPQMRIAASMTAEAGVRSPHFVVNLGDLIYENGVESPKDPTLRSRLLEPYDELPPMYLMGGNHDHRGDVDAIVDFAQNHKGLVMPARYYQFGFEFGKRTADFFVLDTHTLAEDPKQLGWLGEAFRKSTADYKIVLGHHPILSGGEHGDTDFMKSLVLPIIDGKAQIAAAGHEHDQQVLSTCGGTRIVVSGAGAKARKTGLTDRSHFAAEGLGFSALKLGKNGLQLDVIDGNTRKVLHREDMPLDDRLKASRSRKNQGGAGVLPWAGAAHSRFARSE